MSKDMIREARSYYQVNRKKFWAVGTVILIGLLLLTILLVTKTVTAQKDENRIKVIASVEIKKGDTLWSIASEYITAEYDNMNDYIKEIKESNGMITDTIGAGNFIIVPYYRDRSN